MKIAVIDGRRLFGTKSSIKYVGSQKFFQRAVAAQWLEPALTSGPGGRNLFDLADLDQIVERSKRGERPPLLPCELRALQKRNSARARKKINVLRNNVIKKRTK